MIASENILSEPEYLSIEYKAASSEDDEILISFLQRSHLGVYSLATNFPLSEETSLTHDFHVVEFSSTVRPPSLSVINSGSANEDMTVETQGNLNVSQLLLLGSQEEREVEKEINRISGGESLDETREFEPKHRIFECTVSDCKQQDLLEETKLFVKILGTLDPMDFVQEEYPEKSVLNIFDLSLQSKLVTLMDKLDNPRNSAYTESVASYLVSRLVERNICPHFPRLFGVFAGMQKRLSVNFSDEYEDLCDQQSFLDGLKNQKFEIVKTDYFVGCEGDVANMSSSQSDEFFEDDFMDDSSFDEDEDEDFRVNQKEDGTNSQAATEQSESEDSDTEEGEEDDDDEGEEEEEEEEGERSEEKEEEGAGSEEEEDIIDDSRGEKRKSEEDMQSQLHLSLTNNFFSDVDEHDILHELKKFCDYGDRTSRTSKTSKTSSRSSFSSVHSLSNLLSSMDILDDSSIPADISLFANEFNFSELQETVNILMKKKYTDNDREEDSQEKWLILKDVPCQIIAMEAFPGVLEDELKKDISLLRKSMQSYMRERDNPTNAFFASWILRARVKLFDAKWLALTLQIVMALVAMQSEFDMTHNDLHTQNVLLQPCSFPFLFYQIEEKVYRVPTKGYIVKIIDYGRAVYTLNDELIMGDVFKSTGQAGEQFAYPGEFEILDAQAVPNPSFDLCRFACSVVDDVFKQAPRWHRCCDSLKKKQKSVSEFYDLMESWTIDDAGKSVLRHEGFKLYKRITRDVHHLVPLEILEKNFKEYFFCAAEDLKNDPEFARTNLLYHLKN